MSHLSSIISDKTWVHSIRVFGMNTTAVLVEFFCTEWMEIMNIWIKKRVKTIHSTGKHWVNDEIVPALLVYQLVHAERGRSLNHWLYLFGHFHCDCYITWYALEMQCLHLKTKAQLPAGAFVCKHQVVVLNFEHLRLYVLARIDWDGSHFLLKMWVS